MSAGRRRRPSVLILLTVALMATLFAARHGMDTEDYCAFCG